MRSHKARNGRDSYPTVDKCRAFLHNHGPLVDRVETEDLDFGAGLPRNRWLFVVVLAPRQEDSAEQIDESNLLNDYTTRKNYVHKDYG